MARAKPVPAFPLVERSPRAPETASLSDQVERRLTAGQEEGPLAVEKDVLLERHAEIDAPFGDGPGDAHLGGERAHGDELDVAAPGVVDLLPGQAYERSRLMEEEPERMGVDARAGDARGPGLREHGPQELVPGEPGLELAAIDVLEAVGFGHELFERLRGVRFARPQDVGHL